MHHEVLGDGIRQRKPQQHPNSGLGTLLCYELFDSLCCSVWLFFLLFVRMISFCLVTMTPLILTCTIVQYTYFKYHSVLF